MYIYVQRIRIVARRRGRLDWPVELCNAAPRQGSREKDAVSVIDTLLRVVIGDSKQIREMQDWPGLLWK